MAGIRQEEHEIGGSISEIESELAPPNEAQQAGAQGESEEPPKVSDSAQRQVSTDSEGEPAKKPKKPKKPRTEAQMKALEKARETRKRNIEERKKREREAEHTTGVGCPQPAYGLGEEAQPTEQVQQAEPAGQGKQSTKVKGGFEHFQESSGKREEEHRKEEHEMGRHLGGATDALNRQPVSEIGGLSRRLDNIEEMIKSLRGNGDRKAPETPTAPVQSAPAPAPRRRYRGIKDLLNQK